MRAGTTALAVLQDAPNSHARAARARLLPHAVVIKILGTHGLSHGAQMRLLGLPALGHLRTPPGTQLDYLVPNLGHGLRSLPTLADVRAHVKAKGEFLSAVLRYYRKACAPARAGDS